MTRIVQNCVISCRPTLVVRVYGILSFQTRLYMGGYQSTVVELKELYESSSALKGKLLTKLMLDDSSQSQNYMTYFVKNKLANNLRK